MLDSQDEALKFFHSQSYGKHFKLKWWLSMIYLQAWRYFLNNFIVKKVKY